MLIYPSRLDYDCLSILDSCRTIGWVNWRDQQLRSGMNYSDQMMPTWVRRKHCGGDDAPCCCQDGDHYEHVAPSITGAPWYDPLRPESGRAFGFFLIGAEVTNEKEENRAFFEVKLEIKALAQDKQALSYLIRWLDIATRAKKCDDGTDVTAGFYEFCPSHEPSGNWADDGWRTLHNVERVSLTRVDSDDDQGSDRCTETYELVIKGKRVSKPYECGEWNSFCGNAYPAEFCPKCPVAADCHAPSWLQTIPLAASVMSRYNDPFSVLPTVFIKHAEIPAHEDIGFMIELENPTEDEWYNLRLEAFVGGSPQDAGCALDDMDRGCMQPCWVGLISHVPAGTSLRIDPRTRKIWLKCDGIWKTSSRNVYGSANTPMYDWPVVSGNSCSRQVTFAAIASGDVDDFGQTATPDNARIRICPVPLIEP